MPNRIIKESICTSDNIDQLTPFQETVFYRLLVNCDDYGRMDARPKILASRLFPLKDMRAAQMTEALRALTSAELVILYEHDGKPFLQMKTWDRHQTIRAKTSKYPAPTDESICKQMQADECKCSRNPIRIRESESNMNTSYSCAEPEDSTQPVNIIARITLVDGTAYEISEEEADADRKAYPGVDVEHEYLMMERWGQANPAKRKTRKGIRRFMNSWLDKEQNKYHPEGGGRHEEHRGNYPGHQRESRTKYDLEPKLIDISV